MALSSIAGARRHLAAALALALPVVAVVSDVRAQGRVEDDVRGITVLNRDRPEYDAVGIRYGAFTVRSGLSIDQGLNDNVRYRTTGRQSDTFSLIRGQASVSSGWSRHGIGANVGVTRQQYYKLEEQSFTNANAGLNGRYDLFPDTELTGNVGYSVNHVLRTAEDAAETDEPLRYDIREMGLGVSQRMGRYRLGLRGFYRQLDYEGFSRNGQRVANSDKINDRDVFGGVASVAYAIGPFRTVIGGVRVTRVEYTDLPAGFLDLSANSVYGFVGFAYDFDGVWRYEFDAGYLVQRYDEDRIETLKGPSGEARVTWAPTALFALSARASRSVAQQLVGQPNSTDFDSGFFTNRLGLVATYELYRNVIVSGGTAARYDEYRGTRGTSLYLEQTLSVNVLIDRHFRVGGFLARQDTLNENGGNPNRNAIGIRFSAQL